ncbi:MAG TPA: hypothetical protein VGO40_15540 [Longimicrobium sp.]|nr:hypothetical protein [Longimicrobium sp.]
MNDTSTYRKIRQILTAAQTGSGGIGELAERIQGKYDAFVYFQRGANREVLRRPASISSIRRHIRFCIALGLLKAEDDCSLTTDGQRAASNRERFDLVLRGSILEFLEQSDLSLEEIEAAISRLALPDAASLFADLKPKLPEDTFRTCLFLLSVCGAEDDRNILKPFQKKLYLTESRIPRP